MQGGVEHCEEEEDGEQDKDEGESRVRSIAKKKKSIVRRSVARREVGAQQERGEDRSR